MAKLTTTDLTSLSNETSATNTINANFAAVETAMDNTLSRDGTADNEMQADLDMNGNDILNVGTITFGSGGSQTFGVQGPNPSVDNSIARWANTTGTELDDSGWLLSDTNVITAGGNLGMSGNNISGVLNLTLTGNIATAVNVSLSGDLTMTAATGTFDMNWSVVKSHAENASSVSSSSNAATYDISAANYFYTTLTENITTVTFSNLPGTGKFTSWTLEITQDSTARTITWPAAVQWAGGTAPTLSSGSADVDVISFWTRDGGTTIFGSVVGQNFS